MSIAALQILKPGDLIMLFKNMSFSALIYPTFLSACLNSEVLFFHWLDTSLKRIGQFLLARCRLILLKDLENCSWAIIGNHEIYFLVIVDTKFVYGWCDVQRVDV